MMRVLLLGIKPGAVDLSDPDLPPGTIQEKIPAGIDATLLDMKARGWTAAFCSILTDDSAEATIAASLAEHRDCVVIGGGIRVASRGPGVRPSRRRPSSFPFHCRTSTSTPLPPKTSYAQAGCRLANVITKAGCAPDQPNHKTANLRPLPACGPSQIHHLRPPTPTLFKSLGPLTK